MKTHNKPIKLAYCVFFLLLNAINLAFAQNIDSLLTLLKTGKKDTSQVILLNDIAWQLFKVGSYDTSMIYAENAKKMATSISYKKGMASAYCNIGNDHQKKGNYSEALKNHFAALKLMKETNDQKSIASCYNNVGIVYQNQGNYPEALKNYYTSLKIYEKLGNKKGIAVLYNGIGVIYHLQRNYQEALKSFFSALKEQELLNDKRSIAFAYGNIGNVYSDIKNIHESLINYSRALKIAEEIGDKKSMSDSYNNIANAYADQGNYPEALKNYFASLKLANEIDDTRGVAIAYGNIGEVYKDLKNYAEGKNYMNKALVLSIQTGSKDVIKDQYKCLAIIDSALGNYKAAFEHLKVYSIYKDSVYNEENAQQINELSAKYETEKKEKEIALLNADILARQKDKEVLNTQVEEKNGIILTTTAGTLLLTISGILFFSRRQLKQKNRHQAEISKQQENTAIAIIQAQENERNRIAQDLHDGMGTFLSTLKINLQSFEDAIPFEKMTHYKNISTLVDKTSSELRNIMKDISSETLQENGLEGALRELAENVNHSGAIRMNFLSHGLTKRLDNIIEINLYRVAQELVNNCIKHAGATQATLQLIDHENTVLLMLEDNGKGFDAQNLKRGKDTGMGLKNIHNRVNFIKGTLKSESIIDKGSTFVIETPKSLY
ncbi:MAG TPA: tetratricopeptide repeat protein [Bacteroidia bacterium]|jgi:signal transduction histidine kinase|nr:tetratricopeptide repeat protein [Bacteroidia bacterium]